MDLREKLSGNIKQVVAPLLLAGALGLSGCVATSSNSYNEKGIVGPQPKYVPKRLDGDKKDLTRDPAYNILLESLFYIF
jgi:hypothetical protein